MSQGARGLPRVAAASGPEWAVEQSEVGRQAQLGRVVLHHALRRPPAPPRARARPAARRGRVGPARRGPRRRRRRALPKDASDGGGEADTRHAGGIPL